MHQLCSISMWFDEGPDQIRSTFWPYILCELLENLKRTGTTIIYIYIYIYHKRLRLHRAAPPNLVLPLAANPCVSAV